MADTESREAVISDFEELDIRFNAHVLTDSVRDIGIIALTDIETDYGIEGRHPLAYHNARHALRVAAHGLQIARRAGMGHLDQAKVFIAGLCHDRFQEAGAGINEDLSGEYAADLMKASGVFWSMDYAQVYLAIMDTRCQPNSDHIGQNPKTRLGRILADADVYYFGLDTATTWDLGIDYFKELNPGVDKLEGDAYRRYAERFARILRNHRYHEPATADGDFYAQMEKTAKYADIAASTSAA